MQCLEHLDRLDTVDMQLLGPGYMPGENPISSPKMGTTNILPAGQHSACFPASRESYVIICWQHRWQAQSLIIMKMVRDCGGCAAGGGQRGVGCCRGQWLSGLLPLTVWKRCGPPLQPHWILHVRWCYEAPPVCYVQVRVRMPGAFYWFSRTTAPTTLDPSRMLMLWSTTCLLCSGVG